MDMIVAIPQSSVMLKDHYDRAYKHPISPTEMCRLTDDIYDYNYVAQGKVTVPSIDDNEDMEFTHVSFMIPVHVKD